MLIQFKNKKFVLFLVKLSFVSLIYRPQAQKIQEGRGKVFLPYINKIKDVFHLIFCFSGQDQIQNSAFSILTKLTQESR